MAFVKKNKFKVIIFAVLVLLAIFTLFTIKEFVFPNDKKDLYGNRLDGIEDVQISKERFEQMIQEIESNEFVVNSKYNIQGRIINVIVEVKNDTDEIKAKALSEKFISNFEPKELDYYDFQFFLVSDKESERYPFIGYKHKTSLNFKWSNN